MDKRGIICSKHTHKVDLNNLKIDVSKKITAFGLVGSMWTTKNYNLKPVLAEKATLKTLTEVNNRQNVLLLWAAGVVPVQKCSFWLLLLTAQRCVILLAKVRPLLWSLRLLNQLQTKFTHRSAESSDHPFQKKPLRDSHSPLLSPCHAKFAPLQTKRAPFPTSPSSACLAQQHTHEHPSRKITCKHSHSEHVITARCVMWFLAPSDLR